MAIAIPDLFIRADASSTIGTGHFMRCLALAQFWRDHQGQVTFVGQYPDALARRLEPEEISIHRIRAVHPDPADAEETLKLIPPHAPVVLDGYHFDEAYQHLMIREGRRVLVIDDTGHLEGYAGHALLNQNINAEDVIYNRAPDTRLLGTSYVLLGRAFRRRRDERDRAQPDIAKNLLITMGGADPNNDTLRLLNALAATDGVDLSIRVVAGAANAHIPQLQEFCDRHDNRYELIIDTDDMSKLMAWAHIAVAASGSSCWELAYLGVPSILVSIASNQIAIGKGMESRGAVVYTGHSEDVDWSLVAESTLSLAHDSQRRNDLKTAAIALVDGKGVERVAATLGFDV